MLRRSETEFKASRELEQGCCALQNAPTRAPDDPESGWRRLYRKAPCKAGEPTNEVGPSRTERPYVGKLKQMAESIG